MADLMASFYNSCRSKKYKLEKEEDESKKNKKIDLMSFNDLNKKLGYKTIFV